MTFPTQKSFPTEFLIVNLMAKEQVSSCGQKILKITDRLMLLACFHIFCVSGFCFKEQNH